MEKEPQLSTKKEKELSLEEQKRYENITRESLFRIRALCPLMGEKAPLNPDQKPWNKESFKDNKKEFLIFVEGTGKTLEYYGTSEEELQHLEARVEAIHWLRIGRRNQEIGKYEEKQIIESALKAVGSNLKEIENLKNP